LVYREKVPPEEPPCDKCRVDPVEENIDALRIFYMVQYQLIMGFNGPVDVNHVAIHEAIRLYEIQRPQECFDKVLKLTRWWVDRIRVKE
jgi:hypothetical protein